MKTYAELEYPALSAWPGNGLRASLRRAVQNTVVNWYQVAVVAFATFAIAMDLMFPPVRVAIGQGVDVYAGHAHIPLLAAGAVHVDFMWLALELLVVIGAAIAGWRFGTAADKNAKSRALRQETS
jgi:hypothetical protein